MTSPPTRSGVIARTARGVTVLALALGYFNYVFARASGIWRTRGLGDWIDPYLINGLLEQWYYSLGRLSDPASPPMFYPAPSTLGYSCSLILYVPFYVLLRPWMHPFEAH